MQCPLFILNLTSQMLISQIAIPSEKWIFQGTMQRYSGKGHPITKWADDIRKWVDEVKLLIQIRQKLRVASFNTQVTMVFPTRWCPKGGGCSVGPHNKKTIFPAEFRVKCYNVYSYTKKNQAQAKNPKK